jgi:hypothetical protein
MHCDILPEYNFTAYAAAVDLREPFSTFLARYERDCCNDCCALCTQESYTARKQYDAAPRHQLSTEELHRYYRRYEEYRRAQQHWTEEEDGVAFAKAFVALENLEEVMAEVWMPQNHRERSPFLPVWSRVQRDILLTPATWSMRPPPFLDISFHNRYGGVCALPLSFLMNGLAARHTKRMGKPLKSLHCSIMGDEFWKYPMLRQNDASQRHPIATWQRRAAMLSKVRVLHLFISFAYSQVIPLQAARLITAATRLEELELQFIPLFDGRSGFNSDIIAPLAQGQRFPQLHTLRLRDVGTQESLLISLLEANRKSLRHLSITDCSFRQGTWKSFIQTLPTVLELESIYFESLLDDTMSPLDEKMFDVIDGGPWEQAVEAYILHHGPLPDLDRDRFMENFYPAERADLGDLSSPHPSNELEEVDITNYEDVKGSRRCNNLSCCPAIDSR